MTPIHFVPYTLIEISVKKIKKSEEWDLEIY